MSARNRVVAAAGLLVALFVVGAVWLAVRATGREPELTVLDQAGQTSVTGSPAPPEETGAPATTAGETGAPATTPDETGGPGGDGSDQGSPGQGEDPPRPRRTANVAGIRLDGNLSDSCALVSYSDVPVPMRVDGVALTTTLPGLSRDDRNGCPDRAVPPCQDFTFTSDAQACVVGVAVPAGTPPGTYSVTARLALRVECTSTEPDRCKDVGQPAPTAAQPVDALFPAEGPAADITVEQPEPTGEPTATGSPSADSTT